MGAKGPRGSLWVGCPQEPSGGLLHALPESSGGCVGGIVGESLGIMLAIAVGPLAGTFQMEVPTLVVVEAQVLHLFRHGGACRCEPLVDGLSLACLRDGSPEVTERWVMLGVGARLGVARWSSRWISCSRGLSVWLPWGSSGIVCPGGLWWLWSRHGAQFLGANAFNSD